MVTTAKECPSAYRRGQSRFRHELHTGNCKARWRSCRESTAGKGKNAWPAKRCLAVGPGTSYSTRGLSFMKTAAQIISIVLHPFVTIILLVIVYGSRHDSFSGTVSAVTAVGTIAVLPVAILILFKVLTGDWTTIDASRRMERPILYAVSLTAVLSLLLFVAMKNVDSFLVPGSAGIFGLLLCSWILNLWTKISLHMAIASLVTTALIVDGAIVGGGMLAVLPAIAWSRLALKRHTPREVVLGVMLGITFGLAIHLAVQQWANREGPWQTRLPKSVQNRNNSPTASRRRAVEFAVAKNSDSATELRWSASPFKRGPTRFADIPGMGRSISGRTPSVPPSSGVSGWRSI